MSPTQRISAAAPPVAVLKAADLIQSRWERKPQIAIVLGSGLGDFINGLEIEHRIPYDQIPGIQPTTAPGHVGELVCAMADNIPILVLRGRSHLYEGCSIEQATLSVKLLQALEVEHLLLSCAAGGLNSTFNAGDFMLLRDHLDWMTWQRLSADALRPAGFARIPGASTIYDKDLNSLLLSAARTEGVLLKQGTYVGVTGPNYETRAEIRFFRMLGDAIGMSTVLEAVTALQCGLRVCGVATITNLCNPDTQVIADGEDVVAVAAQTVPGFRRLVLNWISRVANNTCLSNNHRLPKLSHHE